MLFIVHIQLATPAGISADALDELKRAESARARELSDGGVILRLWRDSRQWANWGLWQADDEAALLDLVSTLPLSPYMTITPYPVQDHPSDPMKEQS